MERDERNPGQEYIEWICGQYGDLYDDREEDSAPGGNNWEPGKRAAHKSLEEFRRELHEVWDLKLSTAKIRKILITGGCWTTERSREIQRLYEELTEDGGGMLTPGEAIQRIAEELGISTVCVSIHLPYSKGVYDLEKKSANALRIERWRRNRQK